MNESDFNSLANLENVMVDKLEHSPALVKWADIIISFGSSIAIEALLQKKVIIHPKFLHFNTTIFDSGEVVYIAKNYSETLSFIRKAKDKKLCLPNKIDTSKFLRREVYRDKKPHNVAEYYYKKIVNIEENTD